MRDIEQHIFRIIQQKQQLFIKVVALSLGVSVFFFAMAVMFRWPLFLGLLPLGLTGPYIVNVMTARCPHCQKYLHKLPFGAFRRLERCPRCGFRG
jgi:hypothetical protein